MSIVFEGQPRSIGKRIVARGTKAVYLRLLGIEGSRDPIILCVFLKPPRLYLSIRWRDGRKRLVFP